MAAETARQFAALEAQAQRIMAVFIRAGYEAVAPAMIQPAGVFLDVIGEALRARTYVFTDPDGDELCLRPDLTVPACRLYLERHPAADAEARYCYNGPAFRFQPQGAGEAHPREFRQAGVEAFGGGDREAAEADTVALVRDALQAAGIDAFRVRTGDLGLFHAMLETTEMPARWRARLRHTFFRPDAFRAELQRLVGGPAQVLQGLPEGLIDRIDPSDPEGAERIIERFLADRQWEHVGTRTISEVAESLCALAADAKARPLPAATADLIDRYLRIAAPARAALPRLQALLKGKSDKVTAALGAFERRLDLLSERGIEVATTDFSAEFGRTFEYYTGFVFEVAIPALGWASPVAGGGRYDRLLKDVGAPRDVPAVGAAIHTERLLAALSGNGAP